MPTPFKVILRTLGIQTFYKQQSDRGKRVSLLTFISTCMSGRSHSSTPRVPTLSHPTPLDQLAMVMVWSILSICPAHPLASGTCAIIPSHALQRTRPYAPAKGDSVAPCLCLIPLGMGTHMPPPVKLREPSQAFPGHVRAILLLQRLEISVILISGYRRDRETSASINHPSPRFHCVLNSLLLIQ